MREPASPRVLIVGDGPAGTRLAAELSRGGTPTTLLSQPDGAREHAGAEWLPVDQARARRLPPSTVVEPALPVDLILAGDHRLETSARIAIVQARALREETRRRARAAGVELRSAPSATGALRERGGVSGVSLADGTTVPATLTVDASGRGVLLGSLPGSVLAGGRLAATDREPVLLATVRSEPARIQASWVGRAQLLLDLPGRGALAWRCTPRRGDRVYVALSAGPGRGRSQTEALLVRVLGPELASRTTSRLLWRPCRRPLDSTVCKGMVVVGAAGAAVDTLFGTHLPVIEHATRIVGRALGSLDVRSRVGVAELFRATSSFQRVLGPSLARRHAERRLLDTLDSEARESLVVTGALGPGAFSGALAGQPLLSAVAIARARFRGLSRDLVRDLARCRARCAALRTHHARYPIEHDLFALDSWQAKLETI